jgi:hypothetical protein
MSKAKQIAFRVTIILLTFVVCTALVSWVVARRVKQFKAQTQFLLETEATVTVVSLVENRGSTGMIFGVRFTDGTTKPMLFSSHQPNVGRPIRVRYGCPLEGDLLVALEVLPE